MSTDLTATARGGSASIAAPEYWWYVARNHLLETVLAKFLGTPKSVLDVGSADGPSVSWLHRHDGLHVTLDIDPRGLTPGNGVCGSALALPFANGSFEVVGAFDVLEHCEPEDLALREMARVIAPGGRLLLSVPAYDWAWSDFDDANGHHRRYTRGRLVRAASAAGFTVTRSTYAFTGVFPLFAAERIKRRVTAGLSRRSQEPEDVVSLPQLPPWLSTTLERLCSVDQRFLRRHDLPFGSSVVLAAVKPAR